MPILIVVNNPKEWPFAIPDAEVIDARSYVTKPIYAEMKGVKLFNLCRSYRYQSLGYYVTLLAAARGHKPLPSVTTIQDMKSQTMVRFVSDDLDELIQRTLAPINSKEFTLSIYFGRNLNKRYDRLSLHLFNLFQAPLLRATFVKNGKWSLRQIGPIPLGEIPEDHRPDLLRIATEHFAGRRTSVRRRSAPRYDLAILRDPEEKIPPSDDKAISRFVKAAESMGMRVELITRDDYARIAEFDALFIRETTRVNHHTYRFARRAAAEGLVVIDDPESILKCTNKVYLAELLHQHDVPTPKTLLLHRDNLDEIGKELGFPCVLKQPDSSFSMGVVKAENEADMLVKSAELMENSELVIAQEFIPTDFDWRVGVIDRQPLFVCKYYMAPKHWQILKHEPNGKHRVGRAETLPVELAPRDVLKVALRAANLVGNGFYGVDIKQHEGECRVIEINDNPNVDSTIEDDVLKEELYRRIMSVMLRRIERRKAGIDTP